MADEVLHDAVVRSDGGPDPHAEQVATVQKGYGFAGAALELGALVVDADGTPTPRPDAQVRIPLAMLNRHGLVAGATGTGKTKTLQVMAEQLSAHGVPVFVADVKGDLSGVAVPGTASDTLTARTGGIGQDWQAASFPTEFLALGGVGTGVPVRATVTSFGPDLLAKVLDLNDTQTSSLALVFHYADTAGLPLLDLADLRAVVQHLVSDEGKADLKGLGGLSAATAGVILRELVAFAAAGADAFFGEPELDPTELLRVDAQGRGIITCLELAAVQDKPQLFSTALMWLLAELFETLPEVGDLPKPKLAFFFDEAHLLFADATPAFVQSVTQTVRLIRSKGVAVFFITQTPKDIPGDVLGQLGNRVQHALRAFTPDDAKALKATVGTFPTSPYYDLEELLPALGIGEAVVTVLSPNGVPTPVVHTRLNAPASRMAPADDVDGAARASALWGKYGTRTEAESAREQLAARTQAAAEAAATPPPRPEAPEDAPLEHIPPPRRRPRSRTPTPQPDGGGLGDFLGSREGKQLQKELMRGVFGMLRKGR